MVFGLLRRACAQLMHPAGLSGRGARMLALEALVTGALGLWGCGGSSLPETCTLAESGAVVFEAAERLNPDEQGQPLPTVVRLYQLRALGEADAVSFEEVWQSDEEALGEALISTDEVTVFPGKTVERPVVLDPEVRYLMAVGIFRRPVGHTWRALLEVPRGVQLPCEGEEDRPGLRVRYFLEDYRIEGKLQVESST